MNNGDVRFWTMVITVLSVASSALDFLSAIINFATAFLGLLR